MKLKFKDRTSGELDKVSIGLIVLVVTSFALSIITLFVYFTKNGERKEREDLPFCAYSSDIDCQTDAKTIELCDSLEKRNDDNGKEQRCAKTPEQSSGLVQLFSKKLSVKLQPSALKKALSLPVDGSSRVFVQKALMYDKPVPFSDGRFLLNINPIRTDRQFELTQGANLTKTGIRITKPGLYFVYKSINFLPDSRLPCRLLSKEKTLMFRSFLIRRHFDTDRHHNIDLVKSEHTCCPECIHFSETGFSGGVFQLNLGDEIGVEVTAANLTLVSKDVTYVGLMMI